MKNILNTRTITNTEQSLQITNDIKADLYIQVFGEEPRNEWYIDSDGKLYPLSYTGDVSNMKSFYNKAEVAQQRSERSQKPWYREIIAKDSNTEEVAWFALWRETTIEQLNQDKLNLSPQERATIQQQTKNTSEDIFFYLSEIGTKTSWRKQKVASQLYQALIPSKKPTILRTTKKSAMPYQWFKNKWFEDLYEYNDEQQRVIMLLDPMKS